MQLPPPPDIARILRTTLHLMEYYAGPTEKNPLLSELKSVILRNISALDNKESAASGEKQGMPRPTDS
jgi:hypothetical protein